MIINQFDDHFEFDVIHLDVLSLDPIMIPILTLELSSSSLAAIKSITRYSPALPLPPVNLLGFQLFGVILTPDWDYCKFKKYLN